MSDVDRDKRNGAPTGKPRIVFSAHGETMQYVLVKVPPLYPFRLEYTRPIQRVRMTMAPVLDTASPDWTISGQLTAYEYEALKLPITSSSKPAEIVTNQKKEGKKKKSGKTVREDEENNGGTEEGARFRGYATPPEITLDDLVQAHRFGSVHPLGESLGLSRYFVNLNLPPKNIQQFLTRIWEPEYAVDRSDWPFEITEVDPERAKIDVGLTAGVERILPLKVPLRPNSRVARLRILRG